MSWITITLADLNDARVAEFVDALRKEELGSGQTDPMPRRIQTVVDEIRRSIRFGGAPVDVDAAKIPAGLKEMAVEKIVRGLKARLMIPLTETETDAEALYQRRLDQLNQGKWPVDTTSTPESAPSVTKSGAVQVVTSGRNISSSDLGGL